MNWLNTPKNVILLFYFFKEYIFRKYNVGTSAQDIRKAWNFEPHVYKSYFVSY